MSDRRNTIRSVLVETYGASMMTALLVETLDEEWYALNTHPYRDAKTMVGNRIWDHFAGGDMAYAAADRIVTACIRSLPEDER